MTRIDLTFNVDEQVISRADTTKVNAGNQNYFYAVFNVSQDWGGFLPQVMFVREGKDWILPLVENEGRLECKIPWEVMVDPGLFYIGLYAGQTLLTNLIHVIVRYSCLDDDYESQEFLPTKDSIETIGDRLDEVEKTVEEIYENGGGSGGVSFTTDETLSLKDGVLSVNTSHEPDPDNTLPITSAAVATTVGNIAELLKTI